MREVILTAGPRGSGKSTFCEKAIELEPSIIYVSRDKVITDIFGTDTLDPYTGAQEHAIKKMWEVVESILQSSEDVQLLFDTWNGFPSQRTFIIDKLREMGADRVVAWYFVTPVETVDRWFWQKPNIAKMSEMRTRREEKLHWWPDDGPRNDFKLYHEQALHIDENGFDEVVRINAEIMEPKDVLKLQTSLNL